MLFVLNTAKTVALTIESLQLYMKLKINRYFSKKERDIHI